MEANEAQLEEEVQEAFTEFCSDCNTVPQCKNSVSDNNILAYGRDGQPLNIESLKKEILSITEDANKGLPVQHRLNGILWL